MEFDWLMIAWVFWGFWILNLLAQIGTTLKEMRDKL